MYWLRNKKIIFVTHSYLKAWPTATSANEMEYLGDSRRANDKNIHSGKVLALVPLNFIFVYFIDV